MSAVVHPPLQRIVERARQDPDILAVILFGSRARGDASPASDYDVWRRSRVVDRDRVLAKLDELEGYLAELRSVTPESFEAFTREMVTLLGRGSSR